MERTVETKHTLSLSLVSIVLLSKLTIFFERMEDFIESHSFTFFLDVLPVVCGRGVVVMKIEFVNDWK